jgi:hypothetical protein
MGNAYSDPHEILGIPNPSQHAQAEARPASGIPAPKPSQPVERQPSAPVPMAQQVLQFAPANPAQQAMAHLNGHLPAGQAYPTISHAPTTHFNAPPAMTTQSEVERQLKDAASQLEQLRNDLFSAATNISALSDRLERLEGRPTAMASATPNAEVAALRADFEQWITNHLETAVENCMRRVWARAATQQPAP